MMNSAWKLAVAAIAAVVLPDLALADAGLYDAPVPPNSAYVRVIDATGSADPEVSVGDQQVTVPSSKLSPYLILPAGETEIAFAGISAKVPLKPSSFATVVLGVGGESQAKTFIDDPVKNPAKAGLYFYNLSSAPASLAATLKGKTATIFDNVPPGEAKFREVGAFDVSLSVLQGGKTQELGTPVSLKRQNGVSVVFFGEKANGLVAVDNSIQR